MTTAEAVSAPAPKLLKKRIRHTRLFVLLLIPFIIVSSGRMGGPLFMLMDCLGVWLVVACILGRSLCSAYIGGIKNERVVREGPFSIVRNPLYVFSFLGLVGVGLQSGMILALVGLVIAFIVYYYFVVRREEAFLAHKFGEDYARYLREVPRWFPNFSLWVEPQEIAVRPFFLRKTMTDACMFLLPYTFFKLLAILHAAHIIPVYFMVP